MMRNRRGRRRRGRRYRDIADVTLRQLKTEFGVPFSERHLRRLVQDGKFPGPLVWSVRTLRWIRREIYAHRDALSRGWGSRR